MSVARDSLFVFVGFGVLAVQKLQVARRQLRRGLDERTDRVRESLRGTDRDR